MTFRSIADQLAQAIKRAQPYADRLPESVARDLARAVEAWELACADAAIVQRPGERE